ncbi:hypothetical protein WT02_13260 [Burkholderia stagnalis]|nr:hypothetical protein WT03_22200 [Burkholderia stagnalis]KVL98184.1 hypothetical protein WT02_13260 [Burkholderia stagnalis]KVM04635.1 hypothetical protein WT04_25785 [Burkholderia stagnalis]
MASRDAAACASRQSSGQRGAQRVGAPRRPLRGRLGVAHERAQPGVDRRIASPIRARPINCTGAPAAASGPPR